MLMNLQETAPDLLFRTREGSLRVVGTRITKRPRLAHSRGSE